MQTDYHLRRDEAQTLDAEIVLKLREGFSMQFNFIQYRLPKVAEMAEQLTNFTGGLFVNVNAYLTPAGTHKAFPPHYDPWDVFVLQVQGTKKWRLYQSFITLPHPHQVAKIKHLTTMDTPWKGEQLRLIHELVMHPGDLLYMPRGLIHAAESSSEGTHDGTDAAPSLHLSFGANIAGSSDLLLTWETLVHFSIQETGGATDTAGHRIGTEGEFGNNPLRCPLPEDNVLFQAILGVFRNATANSSKGNSSHASLIPTWESLLHLLAYATGSEEEVEYVLRRAFLPHPGFQVLPPLSLFSSFGASAPYSITESQKLLATFHQSVQSVINFVSSDRNENQIARALWSAGEMAVTHPRRRCSEGEKNYYFDRWMTSSGVIRDDTRSKNFSLTCLAPWFYFDEKTPPLLMLQTIAVHWATKANLITALYPFREEYQKQLHRLQRWQDDHLHVHNQRHRELRDNPERVNPSNVVCTL
jgi:hypothetical protein